MVVYALKLTKTIEDTNHTTPPGLMWPYRLNRVQSIFCFLCSSMSVVTNPIVNYFSTLQLSSENAFYFDEDGMVS